MKPITEQRRQELIADLEEVIKVETHSLYGIAARIALASLTAKPIAVTDISEIDDLKNEGWVGNFLAPEFQGVDSEDRVYLYTAPPVTVIKLPEKLPCDVRFYPGMIFRKGVLVQTMLDALIRRDDYEKELAELSEDERKTRQEKISEFLNGLGE